MMATQENELVAVCSISEERDSQMPNSFTSKDRLTTKESISRIVLTFVDSVRSVPRPVYNENENIKHAVIDTIKKSISDCHSRERFLSVVHVGCAMANLAFSLNDFDFKCYAAMFTTLATWLDDADYLALEVEKFITVFSVAGDHKDAILNYFATFLRIETPKFFGNVATGIIIKATLAFVSATAIEQCFPNGLPKRSREFPCWLREASGLAEPFALFIFPEKKFPQGVCLGNYLGAFPDMYRFIEGGNDVLSYYKESVGGNDENSLIQDRASTEGRDAIELLEERSQDMVHRDRIIKGHLTGAEKEAYCCFADGYIAFHIATTRYGLKDVGLDLSS